VRHHLGAPALVPHGQQRAAVAAVVLDVLEPARHVGDAAEAGDAAEEEGCEMCCASAYKLRASQCSLAAAGTVDWCRTLLEAS